MKLPPALYLLLGAAACVLAGCQSSPPPAPRAHGPVLSIRNNSYSLLHQLLEEQKDVSLLRFIKHEDSGVKQVVKRIAAASGTGGKLLEEFAKQDPTLDLYDIHLPPGEVAARNAIAATKKKELLGHSGDEFELALLLTQTEALNYGWHLANIAAENDSHPDRAQALRGIGDDMQNLYRDVFTMLLTRSQVPSLR